MRHISLTFIFLVVLLASCAPEIIPPTPTSVPTSTRPVFTPIPTLTHTPQPTATPMLPIYYSEPGQVVLDFYERACEATWSNSAYEIPCPGDPIDSARGFILPINYASVEGNMMVEAPMLIGLPGQGAGLGSGLFGHYPAVKVEAGDIFISTVACQGDAVCDVEFALEYFDTFGTYHHESNWKVRHKFGGGPFEIRFDVSNLAGKTVEFLLVMREQGPAKDARVVWINPHIARNPYAQQQSVVTSNTPTTSTQDKIPGVIRGWVDMSAAPPYLNDPNTGSSPVVVTFFNLDDGSYWYIQTSLTGHPNFQMTVPPGNYQVVAYGRGVADLPYVSAGYTGKNPSCGQALKSITVGPNARVNDIIIADWNWACGGTAERPLKPSDVPIP